MDAVCINQDDKDEKNDQVPCMGRIYASASRVLVWLGPAAENSDLAMDLFLDIGNQCSQLGLPERNSSGSRIWQASPEDERLMTLYGLFHRSLEKVGFVKVVKAFNALVQRRWWGRVWVVQELAVAREAFFLAGKKQVPYSHFDAAVAFWLYWGMETIEKKAQIYTLGALQELDKDESFHALSRGTLGNRARSMLKYRERYLSSKAEGKQVKVRLYELLMQAYIRSSSDSTLSGKRPTRYDFRTSRSS